MTEPPAANSAGPGAPHYRMVIDGHQIEAGSGHRWKLAPALAAGCTVVAKPSDYSPASAVELATRVAEAGFPPGVFNVVTGFGPAVGKALAAHPGSATLG